MYATFSRTEDRFSGLAPFISGICCVRQSNGPRAQSKESKSRGRLPETVIWPSCSLSLFPMIVKLSPSNVK